jgi:hypothetical protein
MPVTPEQARKALERGVAPEVVYAPTGSDMLRAFVALSRAYVYPFSQSDWMMWAGAEGEAMGVQFLPQDMEWWQRQLGITHWGECVFVVLDNTGLTFNGWEEGEAYAWQVNLSLRVDNHDVEYTPSPRTRAIRSQDKVRQALELLGAADYTAWPGLRDVIPWGDLETMARADQHAPRAAPPLPPADLEAMARVDQHAARAAPPLPPAEPALKAWVYKNELGQWTVTLRGHGVQLSRELDLPELQYTHDTEQEALTMLRNRWSASNVQLMDGPPPPLEKANA